MLIRIISFVALFLSAVFLPWPVLMGMTTIAIATFYWFWEAIVIGFLLGAACGFPSGSDFLFAFFASSFIIVLLIEEYLKRLIQGQNIVSRAIIALSGGAAFALLWLIFNLR